MTREIKFRAWDKSKKQMLEVREITYLVDEGTPMSILAWEPDAKEKSNAYLITLAPGMFELMQYTGLKDKNGKEIYEGDIIDYIDEDSMIMDSGYYVVGWDEKEAGFGFEQDEGIFSNTCAGEVMVMSEVIGNIYENPELLK